MFDNFNNYYAACLLQVGTSEGADIAAAALTVTAAREKVVDFVKPFQNLGFNAVIKRKIPSINVFSFPYIFGIFQPLDPAVWGLVILSAIVVSSASLWCRAILPYFLPLKYNSAQIIDFHNLLFTFGVFQM